jgi:catechol 2,3-dioxygenase-like lactoylglutathione lyase family enzyme
MAPATQAITAAPTAPLRLINSVSDLRPSVELSVRSLDAAVRFYSVLFDTPPAARRRSVALFDLENPQLRLVLHEERDAVGRDGHFGVQLKYTDHVDRIHERLSAAGIPIQLEEAEASCCFSVANKVWVSDPDGNLWEIYVLLKQNATEVRCGSSCACESNGCG